MFIDWLNQFKLVNLNILNICKSIVVGTPGRVLDLAAKKIMNLSKCNTFVLDEADKLLSTDF